jgi:Glycosyl transferase family 64 domain
MTKIISAKKFNHPRRLRAVDSDGSSKASDSGKRRTIRRYVCSVYLLLSFFVLWILFMLQTHRHILQESAIAQLSFNASQGRHLLADSVISQPISIPERIASPFVKVGSGEASLNVMPHPFQTVYQRAMEKRTHCDQEISSNLRSAAAKTIVQGVDGEDQEIASLPSFGVISAFQHYPWRNQTDARETARFNSFGTCELPPESHECSETMLTAVFMAYNPDRIEKSMNAITSLILGDQWRSLVAQVILVWNGPLEIDETGSGRRLLQFTLDHSAKFRVVYPLKMGLPNDLMNRYHPSVLSENGTKPILTKAILYYDDDGPFYSYHAVMAGFELWKRHPRAQVGAMARKFNFRSKRQQQEQQRILEMSTTARDHNFVSHCPASDMLEYEYHYFANYDAQMVLPSGSILHVNYLCFLWHPVFAPVHKFVLEHPAHPDDVTVSTIVSQLSGRAPRVYSRRINMSRRQDPTTVMEAHRKLSERPDDFNLTQNNRRQLLEGIHWDVNNDGKTALRQYWSRIRMAAINSLVQYFGSVNSGSIGWCENTPYYNPRVDGKCSPAMAYYGELPWLQNPEHVPKSTCP